MVCQLGLTGRLLLNECRDEVTDRFELMTMCPRQHKRDIIAQTSRLRVLRCHTPRLSQELSPWLLVTSENVSRHQGFHPDGASDAFEVPGSPDTYCVAVGRRWFRREGSKNAPRYEHGGLS